MAKKKHKPKHRNATPRAPRAPRANTEETTLRRLAVTAAGAGGTALVGAWLTRQGWAPKTIASVMGAVGGGLAWKGDTPTTRSVGAGAMSAAGSQLAMLLIDDRISEEEAKKKVDEAAAAAKAKKPANAEGLPPGALEAAFERARERLSITSDGATDY